MVARARWDEDIFVKRMIYVRVATAFDSLSPILPCWDVMMARGLRV